jgi:hypothetical protein
LAGGDLVDAKGDHLTRWFHFLFMSCSSQGPPATGQTAISLHPRVVKAHAKFSAEQDEKLRSLVDSYGTKDWRAIAEQMKTKNARQCKERWFNYLNPELSSAPWTLDEELLLLAKYGELGAQWVAIAKFFPNRTDAMLKNRFNRIQRWARRTQRFLSRDEHTVLFAQLGLAAGVAEPSVIAPNRSRCDDFEPSAGDEEEPVSDWPDLSTCGDDISFL